MTPAGRSHAFRTTAGHPFDDEIARNADYSTRELMQTELVGSRGTQI
jgi:hypothetical protein